MRVKHLGLLAALGTAMLFSQVQAASTQLKNQNDKLSYTIGYDIGKGFHQQGVKVDTNVLLSGVKAGMTGKEGQLTQKEMRDVMMAFQKQMFEKAMAKQKAEASKNLKSGEDFLAANKDKPGVITLKDGLQYKVVKAGKGQSPKATDLVTVNYEGKLVSGKIFDSSYKRGKPATFPVNAVIPGWQEALQKMKPGATWMLYIPPKLAYGMNAPPMIGPNATLIFKVQLISVKKADAKKAG